MRRDIHVFVDGRTDDCACMAGIEALQVGATSNKTDSKRGTGDDQLVKLFWRQVTRKALLLSRGLRNKVNSLLYIFKKEIGF